MNLLTFLNSPLFFRKPDPSIEKEGFFNPGILDDQILICGKVNEKIKFEYDTVLVDVAIINGLEKRKIFRVISKSKKKNYVTRLTHGPLFAPSDEEDDTSTQEKKRTTSPEKYDAEDFVAASQQIVQYLEIVYPMFDNEEFLEAQLITYLSNNPDSCDAKYMLQKMKENSLYTRIKC